MKAQESYSQFRIQWQRHTRGPENAAQQSKLVSGKQEEAQLSWKRGCKGFQKEVALLSLLGGRTGSERACQALKRAGVNAGGHTGTGTLGNSSSSSWSGERVHIGRWLESWHESEKRGATYTRPKIRDLILTGLGSCLLRVSTPHSTCQLEQTHLLRFAHEEDLSGGWKERGLSEGTLRSHKPLG